MHQLTQEEQRLRRRAREFGREHITPTAMEYVRSGDYPWPALKKAAEQDLIGIQFEADVGGRNASLLEQCLLDMEFCRADSSVGLALHGSMTGTHVVQNYGTEDQRSRWLEPVTRGEATTAIGLTEPETGSDLSRVSTTATLEGDTYVLDGEKDWIANGLSGDWNAVLARTDPDSTDHRGLSLIVVPTDADGYNAVEREKLGLDAAEHARVTLEGVEVPVENRLGEEGRGFYMVLDWLEHGRVNIAACHLGMAMGAFNRALRYAKERRQGGQVIGDYQGMRWKLADMQTKITVAESQVVRAARLVDAADHGQGVGEDVVMQACIAKLYATEIAVEVTGEAVQVFGGAGYARENEVEHFFRDAKVGTIYEGTSEIQRNTIGKALFGEL